MNSEIPRYNLDQYKPTAEQLKLFTDILIGVGSLASVGALNRGVYENDLERAASSVVCAGLIAICQLGLNFERSRRRKQLFG